jgi:hypothetical protein
MVRSIIVVIHLDCGLDMRMIGKSNGPLFCSRSKEDISLRENLSILTLVIPDVEEIAKAIWQRQHDALGPEAISRAIKWRDQTVPLRFWNEFLLDAQTVLTFLHEKNIEYQNRNGS